MSLQPRTSGHQQLQQEAPSKQRAAWRVRHHPTQDPGHCRVALGSPHALTPRQSPARPRLCLPAAKLLLCMSTRSQRRTTHTCPARRGPGVAERTTHTCLAHRGPGVAGQGTRAPAAVHMVVLCSQTQQDVCERSLPSPHTPSSDMASSPAAAWALVHKEKQKHRTEGRQGGAP